MATTRTSSVRSTSAETISRVSSTSTTDRNMIAIVSSSAEGEPAVRQAVGERLRAAAAPDSNAVALPCGSATCSRSFARM